MDLTVLETGHCQMDDASRQIIAAVRSLDRDEVGLALKIKGELLEQVYMNYQNFGEEIAPAIDLYAGMSFQQLARSEKKVRQYLAEHLLILSALYGPLRADDMISPYRLDMQARIQLSDKSLVSYWREQFAARFYERYASPDELIINLASQEFSSLIPRSADWLDIDIGKVVAGKIKRHSTTAKKGRGLLLNEMARQQIEEIDELKKLNKTLKYRPEFSSEKSLFFSLEE